MKFKVRRGSAVGLLTALGMANAVHYTDRRLLERLGDLEEAASEDARTALESDRPLYKFMVAVLAAVNDGKELELADPRPKNPPTVAQEPPETPEATIRAPEPEVAPEAILDAPKAMPKWQVPKWVANLKPGGNLLDTIAAVMVRTSASEPLTKPQLRVILYKLCPHVRARGMKAAIDDQLPLGLQKRGLVVRKVDKAYYVQKGSN